MSPAGSPHSLPKLKMMQIQQTGLDRHEPVILWKLSEGDGTNLENGLLPDLGMLGVNLLRRRLTLRTHI